MFHTVEIIYNFTYGIVSRRIEILIHGLADLKIKEIYIKDLKGEGNKYKSRSQNSQLILVTNNRTTLSRICLVLTP